MEQITIQEKNYQINTIMKDIYCTRNYECYKKGIDNFKTLNQVIAENLLECNADNNHSCPYSLSYGDTHFCKCPLLNYLHKNKK
jgi:hypothetical protein